MSGVHTMTTVLMRLTMTIILVGQVIVTILDLIHKTLISLLLTYNKFTPLIILS